MVSPTSTIGLMVCCNDPSSGLFAGRCDGLEIAAGEQGFELDLQARRGPPFKVDLEAGWFRLLRRRWRFVSWREWVGNWSWNRYDIEVAELMQLLEALRDDDRFVLSAACNAGHCERLASWLKGGKGSHLSHQEIVQLLVEHRSHA